MCAGTRWPPSWCAPTSSSPATCPPARPDFTDTAGNTHQTNIAKAAAAGFASGTTSTTYAPSAPVRRDQMGSFLARVLDRLSRDGHLADNGTDDTRTLDCERDGYPCAWVEADRSVYDASVDLALKADQRHVDGESLSAVAGWLAAQPDVVDVKADDEDVVFRMDGGLPVWVVGNDAQPVVGPPQPGDIEAVGGANTQRADAGGQAAVATQGVAGTDPEDKTAIVLSPYEWQFGHGEGADVAGILETTRGYAGNVTYLANTYDANADEARLEVTLDALRGMMAHDVVHLDTHGSFVCDNAGNCQTRISTGLDIIDLVDKNFLDADDYTGVTVEVKEGRTAIAIMDDSLRSQYAATPGNTPAAALEDTLVYFSACETLQGWDVADAIGAHGVYLGWDQSVNSADAADAAVELYATLADEGVTTKEALTRLTDEGLTEDRNGATLWATGAEDLRLREIVTMLRPDDTPLESGDDVAVLGADEDRLALPVRVEGVLEDPDQAPEFTVRLEVNGQASPTRYTLDTSDATPVDVSPDGTATYLVDGTWDLPAGTDTDAPLDLEAVADLPEGGDSRHIADDIGKAGYSGTLTTTYQETVVPPTREDGENLWAWDITWEARIDVATEKARVHSSWADVEYPRGDSSWAVSGSETRRHDGVDPSEGYWCEQWELTFQGSGDFSGDEDPASDEMFELVVQDGVPMFRANGGVVTGGLHGTAFGGCPTPDEPVDDHQEPWSLQCETDGLDASAGPWLEGQYTDEGRRIEFDCQHEDVSTTADGHTNTRRIQTTGTLVVDP